MSNELNDFSRLVRFCFVIEVCDYFVITKMFFSCILYCLYLISKCSNSACYLAQLPEMKIVGTCFVFEKGLQIVKT